MAWGSTNKDRFPGPQPVSIERRHFPILKNAPYMVCEKTDGLRQMLVCLEIEGKKRCFLVDRAFHTEEIQSSLPRGTVLDCERVGNIVFVYDAVMIKGEDLKKFTLTQRLAGAEKVIKGIIRTKNDLVHVKMKKMLPLSDVETVLNTSYTYETDGLIFTPIEEPIRMGTHETMFKWKPRETITIDFLVQKTNESIDRGSAGYESVYGLYIADGDGLNYIAHFNTMAKYTDLASYQGKIVECSYGDVGWKIVKIRTDKTYPNNMRTFRRTLINIKEDIQSCEFQRLYMQK